jgi:hypothetical protein
MRFVKAITTVVLAVSADDMEVNQKYNIRSVSQLMLWELAVLGCFITYQGSGLV